MTRKTLVISNSPFHTFPPQAYCLNTFCSVTIHPMRRWLSIFLLIVLPLQISWAVAATYCQHETGSTKHFGHHDHKHQAEDGEKLAKGSVSDVDNDCAVCHAGCVAALTSFSSLLPKVGAVADHFRTVQLWASPPDEQPERPNWSISA